MPGSSTEQLTKPPEAQARSSQQVEGRKGRGNGGRAAWERAVQRRGVQGAQRRGPAQLASWFIIPIAARELPKSHDLLRLPS